MICGFSRVDCYPTTICKSILKNNLKITILATPELTLNKENLDCLGLLVLTLKFLYFLTLTGSIVEGVLLKLQAIFTVHWKIPFKSYFKHEPCSYENSEALGDVLSQNRSLKVLGINHVDNDDCVAAIFDGLSSNKSVVTFASWPVSISSGEGTFKLGESFERCLRANHRLKLIDFTEDVPALDQGEKTIHFICSIQTLSLSSQLCSFCIRLRTLDITVS